MTQQPTIADYRPMHCPNCDALMNANDPCPECDHVDNDETCTCDHCLMREDDESDGIDIEADETRPYDVSRAK